MLILSTISMPSIDTDQHISMIVHSCGRKYRWERVSKDGGLDDIQLSASTHQMTTIDVDALMVLHITTHNLRTSVTTQWAVIQFDGHHQRSVRLQWVVITANTWSIGNNGSGNSASARSNADRLSIALKSVPFFILFSVLMATHWTHLRALSSRLTWPHNSCTQCYIFICQLIAKFYVFEPCFGVVISAVCVCMCQWWKQLICSCHFLVEYLMPCIFLH